MQTNTPIMPPEPVNQPPSVNIRDLNIAQLFGYLLRTPGATIRALNTALRQEETRSNKSKNTYRSTNLDAAFDVIDETDQLPTQDRERDDSAGADSVYELQFQGRVLPVTITYARTGLISIAIMAVITVFALFSASLLYGARSNDISNALPISGVLFILTGVAFGVLTAFEVGFGRLSPYRASTSAGTERELVNLLIRAGFFFLAVFAAAQAWNFNGDNTWTSVGVGAWIISILAAIFAVYDGQWQWVRWLRGLLNIPLRAFRTRLSFRLSWTLIALVAILIVCAVFRFGNLSAYPPDMTSDHLEKVRDSFFISTGFRPVFLPNIGGRETGYFYYLTILQQILNVPFNYNLLKIGAGIISLLTILAAYWMGRSVVGDEDQRLGNLTGLALSALIAVSYWHIMLSRLGLRIILMPLVTMLLIIFLARAIRHNRRLDFMITGLVLGFGLYTYQAVRILPVLIVFAVIMAVILRVRSWISLRQLIVNFTALVLLAGVIFVPLGRYWQEEPESFWQRSTGRLFGDPTEQIKDPQTGATIGLRIVPFEERMTNFVNGLPYIRDNIVKSLNMFNYRGDAAWISGSPTLLPQLDWVAGAFMIIGFGVIGARMLKRRDPVDWMLAGGVLIMLLPTALSIVYTIEVPSATRASGALPIVYFAAALGLAFTIRAILSRMKAPVVRLSVYAGTVLLIVTAALINTNAYFSVAMPAYRVASHPHAQAGRMLQSFSNTLGSSGNAFMINYPNWWDHRAVGVEAGDPRWDNGVLETDVIGQIRKKITLNVGTPYELRPDRQMLFFVNQFALNTSMVELQNEFPGGVVTPVQSFDPTRDFYVYTLPSISCDWIEENILPTSTFCKVPEVSQDPDSEFLPAPIP